MSSTAEPLRSNPAQPVVLVRKPPLPTAGPTPYGPQRQEIIAILIGL